MQLSVLAIHLLSLPLSRQTLSEADRRRETDGRVSEVDVAVRGFRFLKDEEGEEGADEKDQLPHEEKNLLTNWPHGRSRAWDDPTSDDAQL